MPRLTRWIAIAAVATLPAVAGAAEPFDFGSASAVTKVSALKGRIVQTRDGAELGRVHDFAVDLASGRIAYVVVSVGSFLIQDSLIAVAPDALRQSADADGRLVLETDADTLRNARRFSAGDWPARADVVASAGGSEAPGESGTGGDDQGSGAQDAEAQPRGSATIRSADKTATLSAGERSIHYDKHPQPPGSGPVPPAKPEPTTLFGRLDTDGNGVLDRAEIAHQLTRNDKYSDIDKDGDGTIDAAEFDALMAHHKERAEAQEDGGQESSASDEAPAL